MNIHQISAGHFYGHSTTGLTTFFAKIKRGLKRNSLLMLNKKYWRNYISSRCNSKSLWFFIETKSDLHEAGRKLQQDGKTQNHGFIMVTSILQMGLSYATTYETLLELPFDYGFLTKQKIFELACGTTRVDFIKICQSTFLKSFMWCRHCFGIV